MLMFNALRKNLRKLIFKCKGHKLWHMRHYDPAFRVQWHFPKGQEVEVNSDSNTLFDIVRFNAESKFELNPLSFLKKQKQKRLAILASGPSIQSLDYNTLKGSDVALLNGSLKLFGKLADSDSLVFHFVSDPNFIQKNSDLYLNSSFEKINFIYSVRAFYELWITHPDFITKHIESFHIFDQVQEPFDQPRHTEEKLNSLIAEDFLFDPNTGLGVSTNPSKGFFSGRTILFNCLQIAAYWGYKEIDIFGADMQGSSRFYDKNEVKKAPSYIDKDFEENILPSLKMFAMLCSSKNIDVSNKSSTSRIPSEVFPHRK